MHPPLSTRAFKYLHKISRKAGLQYSDEEVHDVGVRLLGLCHLAVNAKNREARHLRNLLTEVEIKAVRSLRERFAETGRLASARELSHALGYQSSRSGHLLLHRLLTKGVLVKRAGQIMFAELKGKFEGDC